MANMNQNTVHMLINGKDILLQALNNEEVMKEVWRA